MYNKFENLEIKVIFIEENKNGDFVLAINCTVFAKVRE
jgi:hypothetical protein